MKRALAVVAALAVAYACQVPDEHFRVRDGGFQDADTDGFVYMDADTGPCMHLAPWGTLMPVGLPTMSSVARFSPNELNAYYTLVISNKPTLVISTRTDTGVAFGSARALTGVNGSDGYGTPSIAKDGSVIVYTSGEPPVHPTGSDREIMRAPRGSASYEFGSGAVLSFNLPNIEDDFAYLASNGDIWFASKRGSDQAVSIYRAVSVGGGFFGDTERADSLNTTSTANNYPLVSDDLHRIFFQRGSDVYTAVRGPVDQPFGMPSLVDEINGDAQCVGPTICRPAWISPDGCRLYVGVGSAGANQMYVSSKPPRT